MAKTDFLSAHFLYEKKNHEKRLQNCNQRWYPALTTPPKVKLMVLSYVPLRAI